MKDIPGLAWIVGGFVLLALALFVYAKTGPMALPAAESSWSHVDQIREELRTRKIAIRAGESVDSVSEPYRMQVKRLKDLEGTQPVAQYILSIRPLSSQLLKDSWLGDGIDVAFLDLQPSEVFGSVRWVSFRKVEKKL